MRVMFVLNCLVPGGAELHTLQLASSLVTDGDCCTIVSLRPHDPTRTLHVPVSKAILNGNRIYNLDTIYLLSQLISRLSPQLIVAIESRPLLFSAAARGFADGHTKIVSILHSAYFFTVRESVFHLMNRHAVAHVDGIVYVSENQRKLWQERGYSPLRSVVIPNGIDLTRFSASTSTDPGAHVRLTMGIQPDDYVVGMCAHFRPEKNHRQLIDAIGILRSRGCPVKALLVGDGPTKAGVAQYAADNGLREHVVFAGHQSDVRPYISAFDVGVLCSIYEAAPLAALEIMAMGRPVVITNVGGAPEIVRSGQTGFLFPVGDTASLVNFIEVLSDPHKREVFGRAASRFVAENCTAERMLSRYRDFFSSVIGDEYKCSLQ